MMTAITMTVNGTAHSCTVPANRLLVDFLRADVQLTGTHVGCDTSQCGACVVHVNGRSVKSCAMLAIEADGAAVTTIEGMADASKGAGKDSWHALQQAFHECHGLQCGFCTPGMIMSAADLLAQNSNPTDADVCHWLEGNLCRCTGYQNIIASVLRAADILRTQEPAHV
jgi:aerobic carbon-monoxide dehydrogenase small subunit